MTLPIPDRPLISVVMPVYNREQYVAQAIQSILAQTYSHFEFIIVDDGSTDDTPRILCEWAARDARIRLVQLEHVGVARASNLGIQHARGEMYARMDSDDISMPQRFAVQLAWMRAHAVEVCGSCMLIFGDTKGPLWFPELHQAIRYELLFRISILLPTMLMPLEILRAHPFDESVRYDNYALCAALAPHYRLGNVPGLLMKHRSHAGQVHVAQEQAFIQNFDRFLPRVFSDLYPSATAQEWERYRHILMQKPFTDIDALAQAGAWLVELSQLPDNLYRQRMAMRWEKTCSVTKPLDPHTVRDIYQKYLLQIFPGAYSDDYRFS